MTQSQIRKKITKRDWKTYFKKRWLYLLGALFIYVAPLVIIFEALMRIEPNQTNISISFLGFVTGITYLVFFLTGLVPTIVTSCCDLGVRP